MEDAHDVPIVLGSILPDGPVGGIVQRHPEIVEQIAHAHEERVPHPFLELHPLFGQQPLGSSGSPGEGRMILVGYRFRRFHRQFQRKCIDVQEHLRIVRQSTQLGHFPAFRIHGNTQQFRIIPVAGIERRFIQV